jgi:hypothetical protein
MLFFLYSLLIEIPRPFLGFYVTSGSACIQSNPKGLTRGLGRSGVEAEWTNGGTTEVQRRSKLVITIEGLMIIEDSLCHVGKSSRRHR